MHIELDQDYTPPKRYIGWKIAAFVASCALAFSGSINGVIAVTAYLGGDLVGAVGTGADKALARHSPEDLPDSERLIKDADIKSVADGAHSFALRAKLIALGVGVVAALQLLAGVLVRKRYRTKFIPTILGIALAGELAFAIALHPSILNALAIAACAFGWIVWAKTPPDDDLSRIEGWG